MLHRKLASLYILFISSAHGHALPVRAQDADCAALNKSGTQAFLDGEDGEAKSYFTAAIKQSELSANGNQDLSDSLSGLAQIYYMHQNYAEAEKLYRQALLIDEKNLGYEHPAVALRLSSLVASYRHLGKFDETEPLLIRALAIREKSLGSEDPLVGNTLLDLTTLYMHQGKYNLAEPLCRRALSIRERSWGQDNLRLVPPLLIYADVLRSLRKDADATIIETRAHDIESRQAKAAGSDIKQAQPNESESSKAVPSSSK